MKIFLIFTFHFLLSSTGSAQNNWNTIRSSKNVSNLVTLIISHSECSSCMDAEIDKGDILLPDSITQHRKIPSPTTIVFSNKILSPIFFGKAGSKKMNYTYMIICKVLYYLNPSKSRVSYTPVVDVYQYRFLKEKETPAEADPETETSPASQ